MQRLALRPLRPRGHTIRRAGVAVNGGARPGVLDRPWASLLGYDSEINSDLHATGTGRTLRTIRWLRGRTPYHVRPHNIFNSGTGLGLPHWGDGNVYREENGKPHYDFTIADLTYDAIIDAGRPPLVEFAFTPLALVPRGGEDGLRL